MTDGVTADEFRRIEVAKMSQGFDEKSFEQAFNRLEQIDDKTLSFIGGGG